MTAGGYRRIHVIAEGTTEETVVRDVIAPYLASGGWHVTTSILITKRPQAGPAHRGGVSSWAVLRREICNLLRDSSLNVLPTLFDYYGFPSDAPGMCDRPRHSAMERVLHVERKVAAAIDDDRFVPHLVLHELEAWVFAAAHQLAELVGDHSLADRLQNESPAPAASS